jgi:hypothetical protein
MRKLILEEWISLKWFVADKNGGLDFFTNLNKLKSAKSFRGQGT